MKVSSTPQPRHSKVNLGCLFLVTLHTIINLSLLNSTLKNIIKDFYKIENKHTARKQYVNTLRTGSFKLFKRPFPGFLTILTL
jgi:hypothetical protein